MKYLSLFSGIGGFEYGLQQSKYEFENVGFSEIDKYAKSIYLKQFPDHEDLGDATEIDPKELQDFELLVGGFPCQAFSLSGKRLGFDDTRGTMFFEVARILKEKRPRYFLLENVKGLLSHDGGRTYKTMLGILAELGYDVQWQIYNSKDFGVAQNRERLYIKGYFRAKCGREILLKGRNRIKTDTEINELKIHKVGNLSNTNHQGKNVYGKDGLSPTLLAESIPKNGLNILEDEPKLKPVEFERQVRKRVHSVDYSELCAFLRSHKKAAKATMNEISEKLGIKKSEVDHWFREDKYFAPPPPEVWDDLKELLGITDNRYDAFITEFEYMDGVYERDKRAYETDGLGATLTCNGESLIKINMVGNVNPSGKSQSGDIYGDNGLSRCLTATDSKHPVRILENTDEVGINVVGNLSNTNHKSDDVFDANGISRTLTATNYKHPLKIKEDIEIEKVYNTTRDFNKSDTDGTFTPCLTASMGTGGGNVPMLKLKTNTKKGYDEATTGDGVRLCHPSSKKARGRTQKSQTGALSTGSDWGTITRDFRIRRLTPKECERLQAFPDDWTRWGKDGEEISDTQRYKTLGNAVTTSVVTWIIDNDMFGVDDEG